MKRQTKDTHIYFPAALYKQLREAAKRERRSISAMIVIAVENYLKGGAK